jgi:hypothetical protein
MFNSHGNSKGLKLGKMKLDSGNMGRDTSYFRPLQFTIVTANNSYIQVRAETLTTNIGRPPDILVPIIG